MSIDNFFFAAFAFASLGFFIMWIMLLLTVGRKFDKLFKSHRPIYDPYIPIFSAGLRAQLYAGCCLLKFYNNGPEPKRLYSGYDFRANSSFLDKFISALYLFFALMFGIFGFILLIKQKIIPFALKYF